MPAKLTAAPERRLGQVALEHPTWGPTRIASELEEELGAEAPSLRTVQRRLPQLRDRSGAWSLSPDEPEPEAALEVLAALVGSFDGPTDRPYLTRREVEWLGVIRRVAPDLEPLEALGIAREYVRAENIASPTADLDLYLAMRPWRGEAERIGYRVALDVTGLDLVAMLPRRPGQPDVRVTVAMRVMTPEESRVRAEDPGR